MSTDLKSTDLKTKPDKIVGDNLGTMERVLGEANIDPESRKPSVFKMRAPLPKQGNDRTLLAASDKMWLFLNTYGPKGGENRLHAHTTEDHVFIVLQGRARFEGPDGEIAEIGRNEGINLPRGTLYTFSAMDGEHLVLLRVGCAAYDDRPPFDRELPDGTPLLGNAKENNQIETIFEDDLIFE